MIGKIYQPRKLKRRMKKIFFQGLKAKQKHENISISLMNLKEEHLLQFDCNKIKGFIQYFSMEPFVIGLWTEKDIDMFRYNAKQHALMGRRYRKHCC